MLLVAIRETNRHGRNAVRLWNESHLGEEPNVWIETDVVEMRAFIDLLVYAGAHKSGSDTITELWSAKEGQPLFRATMSLNRAKDLLRHLRFDNSATRAERVQTDKLAPIRDFWEMYLASLQRYYKPDS